MPPILSLIPGGCATGKPQRRFVTTDAPDIFRIAPQVPKQVLEIAEAIAANGGVVLSIRWVGDCVELRSRRRWSDGAEAPVMTFAPAERFARMTAPIPFDAEEDADDEIPVLLDDIAIAARAAREKEHSELIARGVAVLERYQRATD